MDKSKRLEAGIDAFDRMAYVDAYDMLLPLAEEGMAEAQCIVGSMYHTGLGRSLDGPQAVAWYLKAADQGYALACHNLGTIYTVGMPGVPSDSEKATYFYNRAAELGFEMRLS